MEAANLAKGTTVLYVPVDDLEDTEAVSKDKDLVQRLESCLIHWVWLGVAPLLCYSPPADPTDQRCHQWSGGVVGGPHWRLSGSV